MASPHYPHEDTGDSRAVFGPVKDVEVMDVDGRSLSILAMGRISHGPDAGLLVIGVQARAPRPKWWKRRPAPTRREPCCD